MTFRKRNILSLGGLILAVLFLLTPDSNVAVAKYDPSDVTAMSALNFWNKATGKSIGKEDNEYIYGKHDLFALIIIMKQMLSTEEFKNMTFELEHIVQTLNYNLTSIKIDKVLNTMGFPINWEELAKIERPMFNEEKEQ